MTGAATERGRAVLLIEDSADVRDALVELLELSGHRVEAVATGAEGLASAERSAPEVIVIDVGLPDIDGHEVARRLRARHGGGPFLIAVTGHVRDDDRRAAAAAGFDRHLGKPVDAEALERLVALGRPVC